MKKRFVQRFNGAAKLLERTVLVAAAFLAGALFGAVSALIVVPFLYFAMVKAIFEGVWEFCAETYRKAKETV